MAIEDKETATNDKDDNPVPVPDKKTTMDKFILCILAHVDHGKTSVADSLLSLAGIVSHQSIGNARYMDTRIDEREKGITMKTAGFSLQYTMLGENKVFTIVDTPGHVDFSKEVLSAVRSCDGALVVVDVVEGVRAQTRDSIRIAIEQGLKLILVINKFDRLILDMKLEVTEVYNYILRLVETCNMVVAEIYFRNEELKKYEDEQLFHPAMDNIIICSSLDGWGVLPADIISLFLPEDDSSELGSTETQLIEIMKHLLDPNYYFTKGGAIKKGGIKKKSEPALLTLLVKPLYDVYNILGVLKQRETVDKIAKVFKLDVNSDMRSNNPRTQISALLRKFLLGDAILRSAVKVVPGAQSFSTDRLRRMISEKEHLNNDKANTDIINGMVYKLDCCHHYLGDTRMLSTGNANEPPTTYAYISKLISVSRTDIIEPKKKSVKPGTYCPTYCPTPRNQRASQATVSTSSSDDNTSSKTGLTLDPETSAYANVQAACSGQTRSGQQTTIITTPLGNYDSLLEENPQNTTDLSQLVELVEQVEALPNLSSITSGTPKALDSSSDEDEIPEISLDCSSSRGTVQQPKEIIDDGLRTIAVTRLFYGKLKVGDEMFLLQSGYKPPLPNDDQRMSAKYNANKIRKFSIKQLYVLNGRDIIKTTEAGAGCICGISFEGVFGDDGKLLRGGTLVSSASFYPVYENPSLDPVLRVSVSAKDVNQTNLLTQALRWLRLSDPVVKVVAEESSEVIILSSGDVHLSKIMLDLKMYMSPHDLIFSEPIVPVRETVLNLVARDVDSTIIALDANKSRIDLPQYKFFIEVYVMSLPDSLATFVEDNRDILMKIENIQNHDFGYLRQRVANQQNKRTKESVEKTFKSSQMFNHAWKARIELQSTMENIIKSNDEEKMAPHRFDAFGSWELWNKLWSVGRYAHTECSNILVNAVECYKRSIYCTIDQTNRRSLIDSCVVKAFQSLIEAGPLCGEPITRCAFTVADFDVATYEEILSCGTDATAVMAEITNACSKAMRNAMLKQAVRLMEPMFETDIDIASATQIGLVNNIISKRNGLVINDSAMNIDETRYEINALIPASNCMGFANEVRHVTSGFANPYLSYNNYRLVQGHPLNKEDETKENRGYNLCNAVRRRKGIAVDDEVVVSGEKQRTRSKKK